MAKQQKQAGFTLIEAVVAVAVLITVVVGLYTLLDQGNKLAKQETNVAEAQQSSRIGVYEISRVIRQARVGGLYFANAILPMAPDGSTGNNSAGGVFLTDTDGKKHYIRKGTDVIAVRGILSGDKYIFASGDATCASGCATTTSVAVTIHATSVGGVSNFAPGSAPSLINKTRPFYFVVATASTDIVSVSGSDYLISQYMVGLVAADTSGAWYTQTADTFSFTMNPQDTGAKKLNASAAVPASLDKPFLGGAVDEMLFFVDEGPTDVSSLNTDTHPSLAEATLVPDPGLLQYDVQPLVDEVEDFQVAYGVDGADSVLPHDKGISPTKVTQVAGSDEWVGNVAGEVSTALPLSASNPKYVAAFVDRSVPTGSTEPALAVPALRSVWVSLVVKSADPELVYGGPGARGIKILDSTIKTFSTATGRPYRRRLQSFAVSLRNYQ